MSLLDSLLSLVAPNSCALCGVDGPVLCASCYRGEVIEGRQAKHCLFCSRPASRGVCRICNNRSGIEAIVALGAHRDVLKNLIWRLKFNSSRSVGICLSNYLGLKLSESGYADSCRLIFVPAPTAPKRARARGYDQAELMAKSLAKLKPEWGYANLLIRNNDIDQIGMNRSERLNLSEDLFISNPVHLGSPLIDNSIKLVIVDDVITTGSTVVAAADTLKKLGYKELLAVSFSFKPLE